MKKTIMILTLLASGIANANNLPNKPAQVTYELKFEKTKNNLVEVVNEFKFSTLVGTPSTMQAYKQIGYIKASTIDPDTKGELLTPDVIKVGLDANMTITEGKNKGEYKVDIDSKYKELLSMSKITVGTNNSGIDLPTFKEWNFIKSYAVKANESIILETINDKQHNMLLHKDEDVQYKMILKVISQ